MKEKILLDTDIGSDIDDAIALAYLLTHPDCEIVGITTVSGEAEKRSMIAEVICKQAGKNIPVFPGAEEPILIEQKQKKCLQSKALPYFNFTKSYPAGEAIEFMRKTIRENPNQITLLTIGPLTNVALLFKVDPQIPFLLKGMYSMAGWFFGKDRKVEWNVVCDPHAFYIVNKADIFSHYIGLDVTKKVKMHKDEVIRNFKKYPLLEAVLKFAEVWFETREVIIFHDILAASVIFQKNICNFKRGIVKIDIENKENPGKTEFIEMENGKNIVACDVNPETFFSHFFETFENAEK